jgi:hypothetical protein
VEPVKSNTSQAKGISLVERLTHRLVYNAQGNAVEAEFCWRRALSS